jgi:hypothetical protein
MTATGRVMSTAEFRDRLWDIWLKLQRMRRDDPVRPSQAWLARELTERGVSMSQSGVSYWFRGDGAPGDLRTYVALAAALSWGERGSDGWVDPGWLAFGEHTEAQPPAGLESGGWTSVPQDGEG